MLIRVTPIHQYVAIGIELHSLVWYNIQTGKWEDNNHEDRGEVHRWLKENNIPTYEHIAHYYIDPDTPMKIIDVAQDDLSNGAQFIIDEKHLILFRLRWADHLEMMKLDEDSRAQVRAKYPTLEDRRKHRSAGAK